MYLVTFHHRRWQLVLKQHWLSAVNQSLPLETAIQTLWWWFQKYTEKHNMYNNCSIIILHKTGEFKFRLQTVENVDLRTEELILSALIGAAVTCRHTGSENTPEWVCVCVSRPEPRVSWRKSTVFKRSRRAASSAGLTASDFLPTARSQWAPLGRAAKPWERVGVFLISLIIPTIKKLRPHWASFVWNWFLQL